MGKLTIDMLQDLIPPVEGYVFRARCRNCKEKAIHRVGIDNRIWTYVCNRKECCTKIVDDVKTAEVIDG